MDRLFDCPTTFFAATKDSNSDITQFSLLINFCFKIRKLYVVLFIRQLDQKITRRRHTMHFLLERFSPFFFYELMYRFIKCIYSNSNIGAEEVVQPLIITLSGFENNRGRSWCCFMQCRMLTPYWCKNICLYYGDVAAFSGDSF